MEKFVVDGGQGFDFGKTSAEYAKYRDIYPQQLFDRLFALGVGVAGSRWLDLGTGTGVIPRGMAQRGAQIYATDISTGQIEQAAALSRGFCNINYRVCSAEQLDYPDNFFDAITACQCFWYFEPDIIVPKIRRMLKPGGVFAKVYMEWLADDAVAARSAALVHELNPLWSSGSQAKKDLETHHFDNPHEESFVARLPFTRESWHGRMIACRGTLASMDAEAFAQFELRHRAMLSELPEKFTVGHRIFITWYSIAK